MKTIVPEVYRPKNTYQIVVLKGVFSGAAKTSAYYTIAPFVGVALSYLILRESFSANYVVALVIMIIGSVLITMDTMAKDTGE